MKRPQEIRRRVLLMGLHFAEYSSLLAQALVHRCDVLLIVYQGNALVEIGDDWKAPLQSKGVEVLALDKPSLSGVFANARTIIRAARRFAPDLIHCQESIRYDMALSLPWLLRIPRLLTVHDPNPHSGDDARWDRFSHDRLYRAVIRRAMNMVIVHGEALRTELHKVCPWLIGKVRVTPHGPLGRGIASEPKVPTGKRVLFFGRINEYKGLRYFVEAVAGLNKRGVDITGVVAGRGPDLKRYRKEIAMTGCFEIDERYIPVEQVDRLFLEARAVVLPYTDGTQSGVAAMALGYCRPIIATTVGSIPELVIHGRNGLLTAPGDVQSLASAIEAVIGSAELTAKLVAGARDLRDGDLSWRAIAARTVDVYEELLLSTRTES
jgi:glycosyltransferase involved in cell wall biosynthesis